jgi:hypothetical protein
MTPTDVFFYHSGTGLLFSGAALALLFVGWYGLSAAWYRTEAGRHMIAFTAALFLALGLTAANVMGWTRSLGLTANLIVQNLVLLLINLVILWRIWIFFRAQYRRTRRR